MEENRNWVNFYDPGLSDIDPVLFETTFPILTRKTFQTYPDKPALIYMGTSITYAQLDRYADRFANRLLALGIHTGDVVALHLPNIPEFVIALLGAHRAGCAVSGVSLQASSQELEYQLRDSGVKVLVSLDTLIEKKLAGIAERLSNLELVLVTSMEAFQPPLNRFFSELLGRTTRAKITSLGGLRVERFKDTMKYRGSGRSKAEIKIKPDDMSFIMYTAGATGISKGAVFSHRSTAAAAIIQLRWFGLEPGRINGVIIFPFTQMDGLYALVTSLLRGDSLILIPQMDDMDHICAQLARYRPYFIVSSPRGYMRLIASAQFRHLDHSGLKLCISMSAFFPETYRRELEFLIGEGKLLEGYGMTEAHGGIICNPVHWCRKSGSAGVPLLNTDVRLSDPVTGAMAGIGEPGELCIRSPQVMSGYHNRPKETVEIIDRENYLHTGEIAVQDENGFLRILEHKKDMIIASGYKVFPLRIEEVLEGHPSVSKAAVVGLEDLRKPGSKLIKAFITLNQSRGTGDLAALQEVVIAHARERLEPYEVPSLIEVKAELPLTATGKIDKNILIADAGYQEPLGMERRRHTRLTVDLPCAIKLLSKKSLFSRKAKVINLSRSGMFVETQKPVAAGTQIGAHITAIQFGKTYWVKGNVVRSTEKGMAVLFLENISLDAESQIPT